MTKFAWLKNLMALWSCISGNSLLHLGVFGFCFLYLFWWCIWTVLGSFNGGRCSRGNEWIEKQSRRNAWKCGANIWEGHFLPCNPSSDSPEEEWYHSIGWICRSLKKIFVHIGNKFSKKYSGVPPIPKILIEISVNQLFLFPWHMLVDSNFVQ